MADETRNSEGLPPVLTVIETARYLRIGRNAAYELIRTGALPHIRLGRTIRIPRDALMRWQEDKAAGALWQGQPAAQVGREVYGVGRTR